MARLGQTLGRVAKLVRRNLKRMVGWIGQPAYSSIGIIHVKMNSQPGAGEKHGIALRTRVVANTRSMVNDYGMRRRARTRTDTHTHLAVLGMSDEAMISRLDTRDTSRNARTASVILCQTYFGQATTRQSPPSRHFKGGEVFGQLLLVWQALS